MADQAKYQSPQAPPQNDRYGKVEYKYRNGPCEDRSCTDIIICLLFCASVGAMIAFSIAGYSKGNPKKLTVPYDSDSIT